MRVILWLDLVSGPGRPESDSPTGLRTGGVRQMGSGGPGLTSLMDTHTQQPIILHGSNEAECKTFQGDGYGHDDNVVSRQ